MSMNVGLFDRFIRFALGAMLLYIGIGLNPDTALGYGLDAVGAIAILSGVFGFCGLYRLLGIDTRKTSSEAE